jgi:hypothetical protein
LRGHAFFLPHGGKIMFTREVGRDIAPVLDVVAQF